MSDDFVKNIPNILRQVHGNNLRDMSKAVMLVSGASQRLAPLGPTGNLRANVHRSVYKSANGVTGEFVHLEPYAEKQHDELSYRHPLGGEAEYAEKAMAANADKVMQILGTGAFK